ncbi:hypothetical protein B0H14DRAFT_3459988 [Mycena olivaceomarginata]|nr:hypothetical protein B0H14DRAFT_3459988 [Mycena olivaceomarginata]
MPIGDEGGLDAQGQTTVETQTNTATTSVDSKCVDDLTIDDTKTQENTAPADHDVLTHPQKMTPGESPPTPTDRKCFEDLAADDTAMTQENTAPADHNVLIHPEKPMPGEAPVNTSKEVVVQGLQCEDDFESDDRDDSIIFVESSDKDPMLKFSVKKEPHKFSDFNTLEYHETAELPTPPRCRSMSPEYSHRKSSRSPRRQLIQPHPSPQPIFERNHSGQVSPSTELEDKEEDQAMEQEALSEPKSKNSGGNQKQKGRVSTESEDEEEDQAMEGEAYVEPKSKMSRGKQKQKGKQKAVTAKVEIDGEEGEDTEHHKFGPIPMETKKRLNDLYDKFLQDVDGLAVKHQSQRYFAEKKPTDQNRQSNGDESRHLVPDSLDRGAGTGLPSRRDQKHGAILKQLPWLNKFSEDLTEATVNELHKTGKLKMKLQREFQPITRLAQQFKALYKVHMWGYVIDPHARASFVFGTGDDFKEIRVQTMTQIEQEEGDDAKHNYRKIAKTKCKRGTGVHLVDVPDSDDPAGVPKRDAQLHNFTKIAWIGHIQTLVLRMEHAGIEVTAQDQILALTMGLPRSYDAVIINFDANLPEQLTVNHVIIRMLNEETRQTSSPYAPSSSDDPRDEAMAAIGARRDPASVLCYFYDKRGHYKSDCPQKSAWEMLKRTKNSGTTAMAMGLDSNSDEFDSDMF